MPQTPQFHRFGAQKRTNLCPNTVKIRLLGHGQHPPLPQPSQKQPLGVKIPQIFTPNHSKQPGWGKINSFFTPNSPFSLPWGKISRQFLPQHPGKQPPGVNHHLRPPKSYPSFATIPPTNLYRYVDKRGYYAQIPRIHTIFLQNCMGNSIISKSINFYSYTARIV